MRYTKTKSQLGADKKDADVRWRFENKAICIQLPRWNAEWSAYVRSLFENDPACRRMKELKDNTFALIERFLADGPHDVLEMNIVFLPEDKAKEKEALPPVLRYNRTDTVLDVQLERYDDCSMMYFELQRRFRRVKWTRVEKNTIHGRLNNR